MFSEKKLFQENQILKSNEGKGEQINFEIIKNYMEEEKLLVENFLNENNSSKEQFPDNEKIQTCIKEADQGGHILIESTADKVLDNVKLSSKIKKYAYLFLISLSTLIVSNKSEAQSHEDYSSEKLRYSSLLNTIDLSVEERAKQLDPIKQLQYRKDIVASELKVLENKLESKLVYNLTTQKNELKKKEVYDRQKALIEKYKVYLRNPSLDIQSVGEINFGHFDLKENIQLYEQYDQKLRTMADHIGSESYLNKLMIEFEISEEEAKEYQRIRLENLLHGTYYFGDRPHFSDNKKDGKSMIETEIDNSPYTAEHEWSHKIVRGQRGISDKAKLLFLESEKNLEKNPFKLQLDEDVDEEELEFLNDYYNDFSEKFARKKTLDFEMEALGIKNYGERFTQETFEKLMKFYNEDKLSTDARIFIETTKAGYLEKIFNEIADKDIDTGTNKQKI